MIYSVDSTVQLLNNPGQLISYYEEDVTVSEMPTLVVRKVLMFPLNARVCAHITNCYVTWAFKHLSPKWDPFMRYSRGLSSCPFSSS